MNVETMTMPRTEARAKLQACKRKIERVTNTQHASEYRTVAAGLKQLERGRKLIDLATVFADCPVDEKGRPKLAVFRADQSQVRVSAMTRQGELRMIRFGLPRPWSGAQRTERALALDFTVNRTEPIPDGFALVPMVPVEHRPDRFDAKAHHILWEVEAWSDKQIGAKPDIDPYLLRHVGGSLYAIIAEWDLTPLERAVMDGRAAL